VFCELSNQHIYLGKMYFEKFLIINNDINNNILIIYVLFKQLHQTIFQNFSLNFLSYKSEFVLAT